MAHRNLGFARKSANIFRLASTAARSGPGRYTTRDNYVVTVTPHAVIVVHPQKGLVYRETWAGDTTERD